MDAFEHNSNLEGIISYKTLDKDYGRTKFAGPGYGEFDMEKYKELEKLLNPDTVD
ncbi:hypothetical protein Lqui_2459 [Legionella quinlivanii]|uniref:Uncharacterized protein n=1 Tax=Legionella quinlivanii TaxID=45073 RepID=A0A0W0XQ24_9GAMM|nr:hypothetical protein [Legionella quinlivanii]KTD46534.1 hypothetical protein Lqui_2459 [Legionella quinlivanii]MCW8451558.1 hypothetical protein [Legionella quinlivanii]SEG10012.1 hypothetical protein SAMN02746093_01869 [Legionella quinlivanii DSM 21216]STY10222.1 Uncharacterised protein [Legionella quinlivanii]